MTEEQRKEYETLLHYLDRQTGTQICKEAAQAIRELMNASPASVRAAALEDQQLAQRIEEWIGNNGGENTATLLLYEAMKALKKPSLSAAPAGGLGEMSANENIGRVARKIVASLADSPVSALSNLVQAIQDADAIAAAQGECK